jgi:hypothetical protein
MHRFLPRRDQVRTIGITHRATIYQLYTNFKVSGLKTPVGDADRRAAVGRRAAMLKGAGYADTLP